MFDYTGKVVAVTGASSGLGKQMAEGYAEQGANLVLLARRVERLEESAKAFSEKYGGRKGAVITAVDVISGIARCASMDVIPVEGATGYIDTNYAGKAEAAIRAIEDHDFVYVHLEAIDETSHEGRLDRKLQAIRDFDEKIVRPVMLALRERGVTFAILPDHPVPLHLRKHTRTPVPVAVCGPHIKPDSVMRYSEADAPKGSLGALSGDQFMKRVLNIQ